MEPLTPKTVFANTLKRWFKSNDWPQAITDTWAKDPGIRAPSGPWASQICGAMKADFHPRVEFFLAMARFNQFVADQDLKSITISKLRDRLKDAQPLRTEAGHLYAATDFFSLFTGLAAPPGAFDEDELTQADIDEWTELMRENFRQVSLTFMCNRSEAWQLVLDEMRSVCSRHGCILPPDDETQTQEILSGIYDPSFDDFRRFAARNEKVKPLQEAMANLLTPQKSKKHVPIV